MEKKEQKFEEKFTKLEGIVKELESGNSLLDDSIKKYTEAMNLAKECSKELDNAVTEVNKILNEEGTLEDFHVEE